MSRRQLVQAIQRRDRSAQPGRITIKKTGTLELHIQAIPRHQLLPQQLFTQHRYGLDLHILTPDQPNLTNLPHLLHHVS